MKRCDICLDEACEGLFNCNCKVCDKFNECPRFLHATIRITNKCTQKCSHCCFESSPDNAIMMTVKKAEQIAQFLKVNEVLSLNIMGGEFFCNPYWYEIIELFINTAVYIRLVSNGDWANNLDVKKKLGSLVQNNREKFRIDISHDKWHTNDNILEAGNFLSAIQAKHAIAVPDIDISENSIIPVGRSTFNFGLYSMFATYCSNEKYKYSFLIDEGGNIYKCTFGMWKYASVDEYLKGGFSKRFKEFNKNFYGCFISSCKSCSRTAVNMGSCVKNT